MDGKSNVHACSAMIYYAFTTLSTVGFGDYHPKNNTERAITSMILLFGVIIFSYLTGNFLELVNGYKVLLWENEDGNNLSRFFGLLAKFNNYRPIKKEIIEEIESYFEYYWANDKLISIAEESDNRFYDELPNDIQQEIFKNFLFRPFINAFKRLFVIRKNLKYKHSYYKWTDDQYSEFMILLMKTLEPRRYCEKTIIYEEL